MDTERTELGALEQEPAAARPSRAPRANACHPFVRKLVAKALPELCAAFLVKAKTGDVSTMKLLWQMAELDKQIEGAGEQANDTRFVRQTVAKFRKQ